MTVTVEDVVTREERIGFTIPRELRDVSARLTLEQGQGEWLSTPKSPTTSSPAFIASYQVGALLSFKGIAEGVENTNYLLHTETGPFFLTLYEKRVAPEDLPFFLGLMEHLANAGIRCPTPVRDANGHSLRRAGRPAGRAGHISRGRVDPPSASACIAPPSARPWRACISPARISPAAEPMRSGRQAGAPLYARFKERADEIAPGLAATIEQELITWPATGRPTWPRA